MGGLSNGITNLGPVKAGAGLSLARICHSCLCWVLTIILMGGLGRWAGGRVGVAGWLDQMGIRIIISVQAEAGLSLAKTWLIL